MAGLSIYHVDELPRPDLPLLNPCSGNGRQLDPHSTTETEAELRRLFDQISGGFLKHSYRDLVSEILGFGLLPGSQPQPICVDHWIQELCSGREDGGPDGLMCPDLKRRIKQLIGKLLDERIGGVEGGDATRSYMSSGSLETETETKTKCDPLLDMLVTLREVATNPCGQMATGSVQEWKVQILKARQVLFVSPADILNTDFPYRKKRKTNLSLYGTSMAYPSLAKPHIEQNGRPGSEILQPKRRSKRTFGLLKLRESYLPRKRIPIGDFFQADVPEWTEMPNKREVADGSEDLDDSRWLGTRIWSIEEAGRETNEKMIGKGRPDSCTCSSPGSADCIRFHINSSRLHLKSDLGQVFFSWGFDGMGEDFSKSWTDEEQMRFNDLVKLNPASQDKSFWEPALKYFTFKSSRDIASYYFNVFVLRRMSKQIRSTFGTADSDDDDESNSRSHDDGNNDKARQASYSRYTQSFYYLPARVAYTLPAMCQAVTGTCRAPQEG